MDSSYHCFASLSLIPDEGSDDDVEEAGDDDSCDEIAHIKNIQAAYDIHDNMYVFCCTIAVQRRILLI